MALSFTVSGTDLVNIGSGTTLDNLSAGTILTLLSFDDVTNFAYIASKTSGGAEGWEYHKRGVDPTSLRFALYKGGAQASIISTSFLTANTWLWLAVVWNCNGAGALTGAIYSAPIDGIFTDRTSSVSGGSGTQDDDSAGTAYLGNGVGLTSSLGGDMATAQIHNAELTAAELTAARRHPLSSLISRWEMGLFGSGTQADFGRGQNSGAVTGATVASHPHTVVSWLRAPRPYTSSAAPAAPGVGALTLTGLAASLQYQINMPDEL